MTVTVVAGPAGCIYLGGEPPDDDRVRMLGSCATSGPLYVEANIVLVPTHSNPRARTWKVLEAMRLSVPWFHLHRMCGTGPGPRRECGIANTGRVSLKVSRCRPEEPETENPLGLRPQKPSAHERFDRKRVGTPSAGCCANCCVPTYTLRAGAPGDLERVGQIQRPRPEAAPWNPVRYLDYDFEWPRSKAALAAVPGGARNAAGGKRDPQPGVDPAYRRRGLATALMESVECRHAGQFFLEVRESNLAAQNLYRGLASTWWGPAPVLREPGGTRYCYAVTIVLMSQVEAFGEAPSADFHEVTHDHPPSPKSFPSP